MTPRMLPPMLFVVTAALEATLLHLGAAVLTIPAFGRPQLNWFVLFAVCMLATWTVLRFEPIDGDGSLIRPPTIAIFAVVIAYAIKVQTGGGWSLLGGWSVLWPFSATEGRDPFRSFSVLLACIWAWWRGMSIPDQGHASLLETLQRGVLTLVVLVIVVAALSGTNFGAPPWGVVLASEAVLVIGLGLLSLSLARMLDEAEQRAPNATWGWLRSSVVAAVGVLTVGVVLLATVSDAATSIIRAILFVIGAITAFMFSPIAALVGRVLAWFTVRTGNTAPEAPLSSGVPTASAAPTAFADLEAWLVQWLFTLLTILLYVVPLLTLILLIVLVQRRRHGRISPDGAIHESLWSWHNLRDDMRGWITQMRHGRPADRLRDALARLRRDDPAQRIRRRYVQLLLIGQGADRERQPQQTPLEYEPLITPLTPSAQPDVHTLTDMYDRARYAPETVRAADADVADAAWTAIESQNRKEKS